MAQVYDEICRKEWANRAARGDEGFDVNVESLKIDSELLARARGVHDAELTEKPVKTARGESANRPFTKGSFGCGLLCLCRLTLPVSR